MSKKISQETLQWENTTSWTTICARLGVSFRRSHTCDPKTCLDAYNDSSDVVLLCHNCTDFSSMCEVIDKDLKEDLGMEGKDTMLRKSEVSVRLFYEGSWTKFRNLEVRKGTQDTKLSRVKDAVMSRVKAYMVSDDEYAYSIDGSHFLYLSESIVDQMISASVDKETVGSDIRKTVIDHMKSQARENTTITMSNRLARDPATGDIYLDYGDNQHAYRINKEGYCLVNEIPREIFFGRRRDYGDIGPGFFGSNRARSTRLYTKNSTLKDVFSLFDYINVPEGAEATMLAVILTQLLLFDSPQPVIMMKASHGSGKTQTAQRIKMLFDDEMNLAPIALSGAKNIASQVGGRSIIVYDNVSSITQAESDVMCSISNGESISMAKMYENLSRFESEMGGLQIITTVHDIDVPEDLFSRMISLTLPKLKQQHDGTTLSHRFSQHLPVIRGAILSLAAKVHGYITHVRKEMAEGKTSDLTKHRIASFSLVSQALERVLEEEGVEFSPIIDFVQSSNKQARITGIDEVLHTLIYAVQKEKISGTPTQIAQEVVDASKVGGKAYLRGISGKKMATLLRKNTDVLQEFFYVTETQVRSRQNTWKLVRKEQEDTGINIQDENTVTITSKNGEKAIIRKKKKW